MYIPNAGIVTFNMKIKGDQTNMIMSRDLTFKKNPVISY